MKKNAADVARVIHRKKDDDTFLPEERTCLTITIYLHLDRSTEQAFRDGTQQLLSDVEASVRANLPSLALGRPPVVICFSQMPEAL